MKHIFLLLAVLTLTACNKTNVQHQLTSEPPTEKLSEAPDFRIVTLAGEATTLSALRGRYVVLDFWGTWCPWCVKGMPRMAQVYAKYSDQMEIIGIACQDNEMDVRDFVRERDITWTQMINDDDDPDLSPRALYRVESFPTKIIIDPDGLVLATYQGESPEFYNRVEQLMK